MLRIELYLLEHLCYSCLFFISSTSNPTAITYILELLAFNCETKPETLGGLEYVFMSPLVILWGVISYRLYIVAITEKNKLVLLRILKI